MVAESHLYIRAATITDLLGCRQLDPLFASDQRRESLFVEASHSGRALVALQGEQCVGYLLITEHFFGRSFIELLMVDAAHRRQGVGRQLLEASYNLVTGADIFTSTNRSNTPMLALLESLGFERSGIIHNLDPGDPELVWYKRLRSS